MKERLGELGYAIWLTFVLLLVTAAIVFGGLVIQKYALPWWTSIQRTTVENSKSFTDANNNMLETYKLEYSRLDVKIAESPDDAPVYKAQQKAILEKMCTEISTMQRSTVNPQTIQWLNSKGACK